MDRKHYSNAPITEAILDLRVNPPDDLRLQDIMRSMQGEQAAYPEVHNRMVAHGRVEVGESISAAATQRQTGYVLTSADQQQVVQIRLDGFSFSRLAPYENWESFRDEGRRLWTRYREQTPLAAVVRIALRYVNRFDLPETKVELKDFFRTGPEVSPDLTQPLSNFFLRLVIPQDDLKGTLLINQTMVPPVREGCLSVVLDIDLFRDADIPDTEESIWSLFELLRERKNQVFEACITDRIRELIQ